jgi:hypothetical protein
MKNPFSYTGLVHGDAFCNRQTEQTELLIHSGGKDMYYANTGGRLSNQGCAFSSCAASRSKVASSP